MKINFTKMQGLGNDFAVVDATQHPLNLTNAQIQEMANRRFGIGFDQLLVLEKSTDPQADFCFRIFNADGSEAEQCGNGARCMALFIKENNLSDKKQIHLQTLGGILALTLRADNRVTVLMGIPSFEPQQIPFLADEALKTYELKLDQQSIPLSVVNIGNPHAVIQVNEINTNEVLHLGEVISRHSRFPAGTNVGFMQVIDPQNIRLRVYERGSGETLACGSGACAAMVVGRRNGLLQERVCVNQPGGSLSIDWVGPGAIVKMTGPAKMVYRGEWDN